MICGNRDMGFRVLKGCNGCRAYREGETCQLSELIPRGHCYALLHSLLPYMVTLRHGGWFTWERHKDTVVVCCPSVNNNVCVELRKLQSGDGVDFQYRIMNVRGECPFYKINATVEIRRPAFSRACLNLFNVIYPYLRIKHDGKRISCGIKRDGGVFELLASEDS